MQPSRAILTLISASLLVVGAFALSSFWPGTTATQISGNRVDPSIDYGAVLAWAIPILAATAVFFQLYVPVDKGELNVNLADPLAILGGTLFLISAISSRRWPTWRLSWFNIHIFAITAIFVLALLHGAFIFGWTSWAFKLPSNRTRPPVELAAIPASASGTRLWRLSIP